MNFNPFKKESVPNQEKEKGHSGASLKKFLTLFLLVTMSAESANAAGLSMTPDEKKEAIEFMKTSPDLVKTYESQLLQKAEAFPVIDEGVSSDGHKTKKIIPAGPEANIDIEYVDGHAVSISIETVDHETGSTVSITDGHRGVHMDGAVDRILRTKDGQVQDEFHEIKNEQGERSMQRDRAHDSLNPGVTATLVFNAQKSFQEEIQRAAK